jgi:hypothetical protein
MMTLFIDFESGAEEEGGSSEEEDADLDADDVDSEDYQIEV